MAYATIEGVRDRLSAGGVTLRADDSPPTAYGDVLSMADDEIDWFCLEGHSEARLEASSIVVGWANDIAAFILCERRGNLPAGGIAQKYERAVEKLEKVKSGQSNIPGVPRRTGYVPRLTNMRSTMRPYNRSVAEKSRSTGTPQGYTQNRDPWDAAGANEVNNWVI